jgi:hypothetical protein
MINARGLLSIARTISEPTHKHQSGAPDRRPILILFPGAAPRTKSKEPPIDIPYYPYTFYTRNATYKKQGAPDRRPIPSLYFLHV